VLLRINYVANIYENACLAVEILAKSRMLIVTNGETQMPIVFILGHPHIQDANGKLTHKLDRRGRWRRMMSTTERDQRVAKRRVEILAKVEKIPGRIPLPSGFDGSMIGNCGVVSTAVACRVPYEEIHDFLRHKKSAKWKGSMVMSDFISVLTHFAPGQYIDFSDSYKGYSVRDFALYRSARNVSYLVLTFNHAMVVRNGYVIDQKGAIPVTNLPWGKGSSITHCIAMTPNKEKAA